MSRASRVVESGLIANHESDTRTSSQPKLRLQELQPFWGVVRKRSKVISTPDIPNAHLHLVAWFLGSEWATASDIIA